MKFKNELNINKGKIFSSRLNHNNNVLYSHKRLKMNNNIYTINNKENFIDNKSKNFQVNKSIFNRIKNNVLISNTYNFRNNDDDTRKNLKKFFFNKKISINKNTEKTHLNDNYYYQNNDFLNRNKLIHNITKSQRIFKFYIPKNTNEKIIDNNPKFYRYSSSNICGYNNCEANKNLLQVNKSISLINKNKMINSANLSAFKKEQNILIPKEYQKLLKFHKTHYNIMKNNSKEQNRKILSRKNLIIKTSVPKSIKYKEKEHKKICKKRPLSTRSKLNIPKNIYSLDDLLDVNEKNGMNNLSDQISKYNIGKTIGRGAYATVKIVTDKITNVNYAAKIYNRENIKDKIRKKCVSNEIEILKKISHKNIIKLIEVIELKEHILIIQELFIGISLSQYYKKYWKSEDLSKEKEKAYKIILRQIFEAIDYLHKNNIAHLDIKLDNILINNNLEIKLIDFGFGIYDLKKELNHFFGGTPNYMSPEIVLKRPYISILSDIWSLGVLVFKLFCNDYPFKGLTEKDLYTSIKKGKYRIKCFVNYDVKKIINSMLVLEPNKRATCEILLKNPWFCNTIYNK